jgi:hypothetical protein
MIIGSIFTFKFRIDYIVPYYLILLFTFTPAVANQQWIIPLLIASLFPNLFFSLWAVLVSVALFADKQALNILFFKNILPDFLVRDPFANLDGYFSGVFRNLYLFYLLGLLFFIFKFTVKNISQSK